MSQAPAPRVSSKAPSAPAGPEISDSWISAEISDPILVHGPGPLWRLWVLVAAILSVATFAAMANVLMNGVAVLGNNTSVVWGFPIANYVWWIGIGNAGTLISALLLLTRQHWRASINRFAEAMTLFAVSIAGLFPIIHLGRPQYAYWLTPYPNTMALWPQWRSALVWDFWAILSYLLFSIVFFYVGLLPDLATLRDRARSLRVKRFYGALALGWRGSARQWRLHETLYVTMAALAVPLVCSVHSIVGLDFAASLMPGWQETVFPPYFVVGAMFSGFAMVVLLAVAIRRGFGFERLLTLQHFEAMALIILMGSLIMTLSYATEWYAGWYGGEHADRSVVAFEFTGTYAAMYWLQLFFNCVIPQVLWLPRARRSIAMLALVSIGILIGMWFERILIIFNTLSHDYLTSAHRTFLWTVTDGVLLFAPLGFFSLLFLIFVRIFPAVSMHEVRRASHEGEMPKEPT